LYLNSVEENFGFIAAVEVVTNRLKMEKGIREKTHTNKYETYQIIGVQITNRLFQN
jgi:hypothetical protein